MPLIKTFREDIIRPYEVKEFLARANNLQTQALIAFLYGFGNRISEILNLQANDVNLKIGAYISVNFRLLKKKPAMGILPMKEKRLDKNHFLAKYIETYCSHIDDPIAWVFPASRGINHMNRSHAWALLKKIDQSIWPHLFRHSLATMMAENGATAVELVAYFGWGRMETALQYIKRTEQLSHKWASREF